MQSIIYITLNILINFGMLILLFLINFTEILSRTNLDPLETESENDDNASKTETEEEIEDHEDPDDNVFYQDTLPLPLPLPNYTSTVRDYLSSTSCCVEGQFCRHVATCTCWQSEDEESIIFLGQQMAEEPQEIDTTTEAEAESDIIITNVGHTCRDCGVFHYTPTNATNKAAETAEVAEAAEELIQHATKQENESWDIEYLGRVQNVEVIEEIITVNTSEDEASSTFL